MSLKQLFEVGKLALESFAVKCLRLIILGHHLIDNLLKYLLRLWCDQLFLALQSRNFLVLLLHARHLPLLLLLLFLLGSQISQFNDVQGFI